MESTNPVTSMSFKSALSTFWDVRHTAVPEKIKTVYADFIRELHNFYSDSMHDGYLCEKKTDWLTIEENCSFCHLVIQGQYKKEDCLDLPFLICEESLGFSRCTEKLCFDKGNAHVQKIKQTVGPFEPGELKKAETFINSFGSESINRDTLKIPNDPRTWHFCDLRIKCNEAKDDLIVWAYLDQRNYGSGGYLNVPLEDLMAANPEIDFEKVATQVPDTIGGRFVKNYIKKHLSKTDLVVRADSLRSSITVSAGKDLTIKVNNAKVRITNVNGELRVSSLS